MSNLLERYNKIKAKWDASENLKKLLPDVYSNILRKIEAIKSGNYQVIDVTEDCVKASGALLCSGQMGWKCNDKTLPFAYSSRYQKGLEILVKK